VKIGQDEVNVGNGFKLLWKGIIGLLILVTIFGKWFWVFILKCGKLFMNFGESQSKRIDKEMRGELNGKSGE
jgi:hypothetical protein